MKQLGWVDLYEAPKFSRQGKRFVVRGAVSDNDDGLFRQVVVKNVAVSLFWLHFFKTNLETPSKNRFNFKNSDVAITIFFSFLTKYL